MLPLRRTFAAYQSNTEMEQLRLSTVLYLAFAIVSITTSAARHDVADPSLSTKCGGTTPCDDVSTGSTTNSTPIDSRTTMEYTLFLYAEKNNINASFPVIEYFDDDTTIGSTNEHIRSVPAFLLMSPSNRHKNHYVMVKYYKPYCNACKHAKDTYIKAASYLQQMFEDEKQPPESTLFQSYAISCQAYPHLCGTDVLIYPTIRMHEMNTGNVIELDFRRMHPYSIMERMGFDDTVIHTNIYMLSKHLNQQPLNNYSTLKFEQLVVNDRLKQIVEEIDYIYNHIRPSDLEQDLHVTVDTMLRYYTYVPNNVNMTTKRSARDPPLKTQSAHILRIFLEMLLRVISPVKNSHLQRFHSMIKELSTSFIYIVKHAGYLPVILDEFRIQPKHAPKLKNGKSGSQYSKDCAPHQPGIIITANDDDSPSISTDKPADDAPSSNDESSTAPYQCGLWKLLFHIVVGGGLTNYNIVATNDIDKIPDIDVVAMVRDYATHIGFGVWSDHEIQILYNTTFENDTDTTSCPNTESSEMKLSLWLGTIRHVIQRHRMANEKDVTLAMWPSPDDCPNCWIQERGISKRQSQNKCRFDRPALWNDQIVFKYIQLEYGAAPDIIDDLVQLYMDVHPEEFDIDHHDEL